MTQFSILVKSAAALAAAICILSLAPFARAQTPFSAGAHFVAHRAPELGQTLTGYGFVLNYSFYLPLISAEAEVNIFPTSSTGNLVEKQLFLGPNLGTNIGKWGAYVKFHPGFAHFGGGALPNRLSEQTKFAMDMGGILEYHLVPKITLRGDVSNVSIRYGSATLSAGPGGPIGTPLGTRNTLQATIGLMVHF
jgi:hypothetical protein